MRTHLYLITPALLLALCLHTFGADDQDSRASNTVILNDTGVRNLRLETVVAEESDFERTVFALGHLDVDPARVASIASRVPGRVTRILAHVGQELKAGDAIAEVDTRQPGNPPPAIALATPIDGTLTSLDTRLGDPVESDRVLAVVSDRRAMQGTARIPQYLAGQIPKDAAAHIRVATMPDRIFEGRLVRFGPNADEDSGTIEAVFSIIDADNELHTGVRAEFSIVVGRRTGVTSVPRSAVQGDRASPFVYVKDFELPNAYIKTPVILGERNDRMVEIVSGLLPADEVVTRGAYSLAFSGGGSVSLKEALDAAHGHEHNADGSELTAEKRTSGAHSDGMADGKASPTDGGLSWKLTSAVLFVLLLVSFFRGRRRGT